MNLQSLAANIVQAVSPALAVQWSRSAGYTTNPDGSRVPAFSAPVTLQGQVQALTSDELHQISGLNVQGEKLAIYCNGAVRGASVPDGIGGDTFTLPDGSRWLVLTVLEDWGRIDGWTKAAIVRQQVNAS